MCVCVANLIICAETEIETDTKYVNPKAASAQSPKSNKLIRKPTTYKRRQIEQENKKERRPKERRMFNTLQECLRQLDRVYYQAL